ncbi:MAG: FliI/YscN family ATPase [Oligoflexia bacterium]|nr:FliI/YscN family ATPase [Oligoflexia bacterium]
MHVDDSDSRSSLDLDCILNKMDRTSPYQRIGKVFSSKGTVVEVTLPRAIFGSSVEFVTSSNDRYMGEVVGLKNDRCLVMPYREISGINSETLVYLRDLVTMLRVSPGMVGRVLDYQGVPIDGKGPINGTFESRSIFGEHINPLKRPAIREPLDVGIRAINGFTTLGKGQRIAIMAGSGVGKSILLGMVARNTVADINVIALVGERGREVLEFVESDLGPEGLKRSVVVVATSEMSPLIRVRAAYTAMTIAEYFRDKNNDVLMMMDSITRFAMANREIAISSGEPPGHRGYAPSVFSKMPKLLERAGTKEDRGSITCIVTVLVEGDDMDEPVADCVRSIADGHIVLSRNLAIKNHFPAIDILSSISRVMDKVVTKEHRLISGYLRDLIASYMDAEDLISVGAYVKGTNVKVDKAINIFEIFMNSLKQGIEERSDLNDAYEGLVKIAQDAENSVQSKDVKPEKDLSVEMNMI